MAEIEPSRPEAPHTAGRLKRDFFASLVVFMVALPLCLAIARASGVPAEAGLITGIVGGLLVGLISGSPLQVSGPAAGLIVLVLDIIKTGGENGVAFLGVAVFLAGLMQLAAGALKLGQWFRAVSPAVILGMLGGIGVVIIAKQFHVMVDDTPEDSVLGALLSIPDSAVKGFTDNDGSGPNHRAAAFVGGLTLLVLMGWKLVAPKRLQLVPAPLLGVLAGTLVAVLADLPIQRVAFDDLAAAVRPLDPALLADLVRRSEVWVAAATIAMVASAETLLCATAVDQMHQGPRTRYNRELAAQGVGNTVCGWLGGLPMTGVIVRSSANVEAGAATRLSTILHGAWLLVFVVFLPQVLRLVPTAALAAILVYTGYKLVNVKALRGLFRTSWGEGLIAVVTLGLVVLADLLTGVLVGVGLSVAKLAYTFSHLRVTRQDDPVHRRVTLHLEGSATFLKLPDLAQELETVPPGAVLHVHFQGLTYIDHACLDLLMNWSKNHEASGGRLVIDWDNLHARFRPPRLRSPSEAQDPTTTVS